MIRDKVNRVLIQGYKSQIMSFILINQQHNGANLSLTPLNMALFLRIYGQKLVKCAQSAQKTLVRGDLNLHGGGTKNFWDGGDMPLHVRHHCSVTVFVDLLS